MHRCEEDDDEKSPPVPGIDPGDGGERQSLVSQWSSSFERRDAEIGQQWDDAAISVVDVLPYRRGNDARDRVRDEVDQPEEQLKSSDLGEEERAKEGHRDRNRKEECGPEDDVNQRVVVVWVTH